jgi:endonuclease YncB( thermonuclease family)
MNDPAVTPTEPPKPPPARPALDLGILDAPPSRTRRRGPDRLTRVLALVLLLVLAFSCGTRVGKRAANPAPPPAATSGNSQPASGVAVAGRIKVIDGSSLYVTDAKGETTRVLTSGSTRVLTTKPGSPSDVRPGDTVQVKGARNPDGTVTATELTNTPDEPDL